MDIWVLISVARQIDGDFVLVKVEKACQTEDKAKEILAQLQKDYMEPNGSPKKIKITTEYGEVACQIVLSVMKTNIE